MYQEGRFLIITDSIDCGKWRKIIVRVEPLDTPDTMSRLIDRIVKDHGCYVILELNFSNKKTDCVVIDGETHLHIFKKAWKIRGKISCLR